MSRFKLELKCPEHNEPLKISRWMGNLKSEGSDNPRLVYDIGGNILLIQRHYSCAKNMEGSHGSGHRYSMSVFALVVNRVSLRRF